MSYCKKRVEENLQLNDNKTEYGTNLRASYEVLRKCAKCGKKEHFVNTGCFRVNANGNKVDVWLIYQCKKCKHTCNLTIYERRKPSRISSEEYERFMANDEELALQYGTDKEFFARNRAEVILRKVNSDGTRN